MNGKRGDKPAPDAAGRDERLAAALRENLKRRKAQARGRAKAATDSPSQQGTTVRAIRD